MNRQIRVIQYGMGGIGCAITRVLSEKNAFRIVGAIDNDPNKIGKDAGELAGLEAPLKVKIEADPLKVLPQRADIAVLTTTSTLRSAKEQLLTCLSFGKSVISTCEELTYPWIRSARLADEIDRAARNSGVSVLGAGVNPGFLMDFLPMILTAVCQDVKGIRVERIQNAAIRRKSFQWKIGAGLTAREFETGLAEGRIGHAGLTESMHLIAAGLGWQLDNTQDIVQPVTTDTTATGNPSINAGNVIGIEQTGVGYVEGRQVIHLLFKATIGEPNPYDRIHIDGTPAIDSVIRGGVNGDIATAAIVVNAMPKVIEAPAGLRTMADMNPISFFRGRSFVQ